MSNQGTFDFTNTTKHKIGLILLVLSFGYYAVVNTGGSRVMSDPFSYIIYAIAMIYGLIALFTKNDLHIKTIGLSLMYVACFSPELKRKLVQRLYHLPVSMDGSYANHDTLYSASEQTQ